MSEALNITVQWLWSFGLASYMPLMVLGASYAYRVQPSENGYQEINENYNEVLKKNEALTKKYNTLLMEHQAIDEWRQLPANNKAALIYQLSNGDKPDVKELAELLKCSKQTVRLGYRKASES